jgi:catechol 2,3-dioxygenase-like lactoylglutathione lyase family enzyme
MGKGEKMMILGLDHFVLTVNNIEKTVDFYTRVLGMQQVIFGTGRKALQFGSQKINLHEAGREFEPKAKHPIPGSADLCFIVEQELLDIIEHLKQHNIAVEDGIVSRTGAMGPIESIYLRDPDGNLIELSRYLNK